MKKIRSNTLGIDSGDVVLFSDFEDNGEMWTGQGQRERRRQISFSEPFRGAPKVQLSFSMWDVDNGSAMRADIAAENVTEEGFEMVFRTWGDTRVARVRLAWTALGALSDEDSWDVL